MAAPVLIVTVFLAISKSLVREARLISVGESVTMLISLLWPSSACVVLETVGKSVKATKSPSTMLAQANKILRLDFVLRQNFCFCILYDLWFYFASTLVNQ